MEEHGQQNEVLETQAQQEEAQVQEVETQEDTQPEAQVKQGKIMNVGFLDLRGVRSAEEFSRIESIMNVGMILVQEDQMAYVGTVPMENVGGIVPVPVGPDVKILSGQMEISGESLAAQGDENTILVLAGQLILTSPVTALKSQLVVAGQLLAPRASESVIGAKLQYSAGQILYYKGGTPRMLVGNNTITADFLEMASDPLTLILIGDTRFTSEVTVDLLRNKVHDLVLIGNVHAPLRLHGALQYLASTKVGDLIDSEAAKETTSQE
ncbi:hypothetical protein [Alicyclobacillus fodiniaquatilis]|uniref:Uncharacterized protein n=1 Tax=Alicyclobacillus fodiniaquatilis TaxID=1661150 RepID=A0ABW4JLG0_9BACL